MVKIRDYWGKGHYVLDLGPITMKEFAKKYNEASESEDKLPVASTILPVMKDGSSTSIFNCVIFYETASEKREQQQQELEKKPKIKLEL